MVEEAPAAEAAQHRGGVDELLDAAARAQHADRLVVGVGVDVHAVDGAEVRGADPGRAQHRVEAVLGLGLVGAGGEAQGFK